jgi:hypothetical protein
MGDAAMAVDRTLDKLRVEQEAFDSQLDELMQEHAGQFVLMKGGDVVGYYDSFQAAYSDGVLKYGPADVFLVSEVKHRPPESPSISWTVGAMFGGT